MKLNPAQRIFCSYAYTGEDKQVVNHRMKQVVRAFESRGVAVYCNLFDDRTAGFTGPEEYMRLALGELRQSDVVFAIKASERHSEGQIMEVGAALTLGIPVVIAQHQSSLTKTYLPSLANDTYLWSNEAELLQGIGALYETIAV